MSLYTSDRQRSFQRSYEIARAVCQFCGRAVCQEHAQTQPFFTGYGQKVKDNIWPSGSATGIAVGNAIWCGICEVDYNKTY